MALWSGVLIPFVLSFLLVSRELCFLHQWGAASMNCCGGTTSDFYSCVTGKDRGGEGGGSWVCKSKASPRQDGDSVTPHIEGVVSASACGGVPDLIAKQ